MTTADPNGLNLITNPNRCPACGHLLESHEVHDEPPHVCHECYFESDKSDGYGQRWCSMGEEYP